MQIGTNLAIAKFKEEVINLINECGLPPAVISVCLEAVKGTIDIQANLCIASEEKQYNEDLAKESEHNGEEICKAKLE